MNNSWLTNTETSEFEVGGRELLPEVEGNPLPLHAPL